MRTLVRPLAALVTTLVVSLPGHAVVLDFSGNVCSASSNGGGALTACGNGDYINQAYGDSADVDVRFNSGNAGESMFFWGPDYSNLQNVAYGASGGTPQIDLRPLNGASITLNGFDLGGWQANANSAVSVIDLATNQSIFSSGPITVSSVLASSFAIGATSTVGFQIRFGPDGYNVGIDNINFSVTPVPEPSTWAMALAGLLCLGGALRRRSAATQTA